MRAWADGFAEFLTFREPEAGALCLMRYRSDIPSFELCDRIRVNQSVLIVPGVHLGLEGFVRVWLGGKPEGLRRIGLELRKEAACA
jgi:aspartate/methionine/tyrosine aminotransferase